VLKTVLPYTQIEGFRKGVRHTYSAGIKRRSRVATLFPNEAALLRLVSAVLMEISEEWETEKLYLRMENSSLVTQQE
jgi:transposase-like protein